MGACALLAGCGFDTSGQGSGAPPSPGEDSADGTEATGAITGSATGMDDEASDGVVDTTMGSGPSHPAVTISDGPMFDFGGQNFGEPVTHTFTVSNMGGGDAEDLLVGALSGSMTMASTDCGAVLPAGDSCIVDVEFLPSAFGQYTEQLELTFSDAGTPASASRTIMGRGVGSTPNLLINGDAELAPTDVVPPAGWFLIDGTQWSANDGNFEVSPRTGSRLLSPGSDPSVGMPLLGQSVDISGLSTWGDAEGLTVVFEAYHRGSVISLDDSWLQLRFGNVGGELFSFRRSGGYGGDSWHLSEVVEIAPVGSYSVQVEIICENMSGNTCDGFFDDIQLRVEWEG